MHDRSETLRAAFDVHRRWREIVRFLAFVFTSAMALCACMGEPARADMPASMPPAMEPSVTDPSAAPMSQSGGGDIGYFSQDLGTILRLRYNNESYGQDGMGNFDIGTMRIVTMDDSAAFFDGQVTMNDVDGVGFNLGLGYRWIGPSLLPGDNGRMEGMSLWADGTHTKAGNFFPQVGVSYESLGELWDVRANGYIPVGDLEQVGAFKPTETIGFQGNSVSNITVATVDRAFYSGELEFARRLGDERDAWGFAGPYFVANDQDSSAGFRIGARGYAYPDLLLQFAVSHDDVFKTSATFTVEWFVGRTRTDFRPSGGIPDRFREPVMRNDYVVLSHTKREGGVALTAPDGTAIDVVHVDSNAPAGGDGTFEHPFDQLTDANGTGSKNGDIIFAHSTSVFNNETSLILKNNQKLFGEGDNHKFTIATAQKGTVTLPESSPGARALARPVVNIAPNTDAVTLADNNEVANFTMNGQNNAGTRAIAAPAGGGGNPNLHDLSISNTLGDAIFFHPESFIDTNDVNGNGNTTERIVRGNVTVNNLALTNIGGDGVHIDSSTPIDVTMPNVVLQEAIALSNITSTGGAGNGLNLENTHTGTGHTTTISNYTYDGGTTSLGGIRLNNFKGTLNGSNSTLTNGSAAGSGLEVVGDTDGTITLADTVVFNKLNGTAVNIDGNVGGNDEINGTIEVDGAITSDTGRSVSIQNIGSNATVTMLGNITDSGLGVSANSNSGGSISFARDLTLTTTTHDAVSLTNNTGADIDFSGKLAITTTTGNGFVATGGGTITASGTTNTINTTSGQIAKITGMTISNNDVRFSQVNRTASAATNAIQLENNSVVSGGSGTIEIGTTTNTVGQTGTIVGGTTDAILVRNTPNVTITGVRINNTSAVAGVNVDKTTTTPMTVNLNDLEINGGAQGIEVTGHGTAGNTTMTINDTNINGSTVSGLSFNDVDHGTINANNVNLDGNNAAAGSKGVVITNSDATFTFDSATAIHEWGDNDFEVNGGAGTVTMNGSIVNSSNTNPGDTTGHSIEVHNITGGNVTFASTNTISDTNQGILVTNNTGGQVNLNGTYTLKTGANDAVTMTNNTNTTLSIGQLDITTTTGQGFVATGGGTLTVSGTTNKISRDTAGGNTGRALDIENMAIGAVDFQSVNDAGGDNGIRLVNNTSGTITIGAPGNAVAAGGTISDTADAAVHAVNSNVTLNGVSVSNAGNAAGEYGVEALHTDSNAMNANFNNLHVINTTAARNGVNLDGTGGSGTFNANVQNMVVNVKGDGFTANSGVTLTAGGTNQITSDTGVGLKLTNISIAAAGANFQAVNVNNGSTNGIVMQNVAGPGQVAVTGTGSTTSSGGVLTTAGDAIILSNVANADIDNVHITTAGGQGVNIDHTSGATTAMDITLNNLLVDNGVVGNAIDVSSLNNSNGFSMRLLDSTINGKVVMNHASTSTFELLVDNNRITTTGNDVAFAISFTGAAQDGDVTIRNNNTFTAANAAALSVTASGANASVEFASDASTFNNNSGTANAATFLVNSGAILNANITNNTYSNPGAAAAFAMTADGAATHINLDLTGNTSNDSYELTTQNQGVPGTDFNFSVVDRNNTATNNTGAVHFNPVIGDFQDIPGPVEQPIVP